MSDVGGGGGGVVGVIRSGSGGKSVKKGSVQGRLGQYRWGEGILPEYLGRLGQATCVGTVCGCVDNPMTTNRHSYISASVPQGDLRATSIVSLCLMRVTIILALRSLAPFTHSTHETISLAIYKITLHCLNPESM